jgi:two-component system, NarL family, sensor histidine kinase UhpB
VRDVIFPVIFPFDRVRRFPWATLLLALLGLLVAAIGAWCLAAWHDLATTPPGLDRLQYDTAWAFVFGGVALAAHASRLSVVGRWCAAVPILLAVLRLAAYGAPGWIDVHPLAGNPWLPYGAGHYNDMGVLTALVFVPLGCALAAVDLRANRALGSVLVAMLAAIALALASLLLFGAWTGGMFASKWLLLSGGERTSALLFLLLSGGVLALILFRSEDEQRAVRRWMPGIVWFAAFACALVLWQALSLQQAGYVHSSTLLVAADVKNRIERAVDARIRQLDRLAQRSLIYGFSEEQWQRDAGALLDEPPAFQSIGWAGEDLRVRWVVPESQASRIGETLRSSPGRDQGLDEALRTHGPALTRLVSLRAAASRGFVIYAPAFDGDSLRGVVAAGLTGNWLSSLLGDRFDDYFIALSENAELASAVGASDSAAGSEWTQEQTVRVVNGRWALLVTPTREHLRRTDSHLPEAALGLGTVLATLLGLCTYLFQTARRRARALGVANVRLRDDIKARQEAERALQQSEQRTRLIINAIRDCAIYMLDPEGRIASWNPGAEALNGYTAREVLGRHFSIGYPPDRKSPPEDELTIAARQGWFEEECWHVRKDGTRYCGDDIISPIRREDGALQGFAVVTRDATPRIALREQTERSRDFYFALFSGFPNLVWRSDAAGACDYLNQSWLDYTGRSREAELGDGWLEGVHPEDRAHWRETYARAFAALLPFELEFRLRRADGAFGSMICVGRPYHDMQGQFAGYLCSCYDNTARRDVERALRESEARYEGIAANVPGMVFELVRDGTGRLSFAYVSPGAEALTGLRESDLTADAESFFRLVPAGERARLAATLDASAAQLINWNWAGRLVARDVAAEKWINIRARPRRLDGDVVLWDGLVFDDTQGRLAQLEIERSREELRALSRHLQTVREEEKARIAREVHDELGSTLTALKMDLDILGEKLRDAPDAIRHKRAAMDKLVESAVATTRRIVTDLRPSILDDLGLSAALRWQAVEFAKHSDTRVQVDAGTTDHQPGREVALALFRIFQETLTNVARHARATEVWVKLATTADALVLQIRDNGVGLSPEDLGKPASHGLRGMRERAQQVGGDVTVSSQPGSGTTVVISVPRDQARRAG